MRRSSLFFGLTLSIGLLCSACTQQGSDANAIKVWTGMDAEYPTLLAQCEEFERQSGLKVELLKVPFGDLRNKYLIAAPAGLGPDIIIGAQDWVGILATAGLLDPIPQTAINPENFFPAAVESVKFKSQVYMAPLCMECLAVLRNKKFMPEQPATLAQLVEKAKDIQTKSGDKVKGFYFEIKQPYFSMPFLTADGGYMLGKDAQGNYVSTDIGLANEGAVKGAQFLRDLVEKDKLIQIGSTDNIAQTIFVQNQAAVVIQGPWFLDALNKANEKAAKNGEEKIDYSIDPFPATASGNIPKPILGVQGFMLNKYSERKDQAAQLISFLESDKNIADMSLASGRPPTTPGALEMCQSNPDIVSFTEICKDAVPMPTDPAVAQIWDPTKQCLEIICSGNSDIKHELETNRERIIQSIEMMME
ncbi:extracellular solute-binding protein [bacterium]|nr:extracellular solute-binding protein [bacterium]